ncbi:MAG: ribosome biogenesis factor YjgA [Candidatus Nitrotoga sp.]
MQKELENEIEQDTAPSKTKRKKDMHALQEIGEQLVEIDPKKLNEFDLPEILSEAIKQARAIHKHGARRRQLQYIGRLMREVDALPIQEKLDSWRQVSVHQTARLHQMERWRERLLSEEHALTEFAQKYPAADLQRLRLLIRNAHKEKIAEKPPKSFRLLFQELHGIITDV